MMKNTRQSVDRANGAPHGQVSAVSCANRLPASEQWSHCVRFIRQARPACHGLIGDVPTLSAGTDAGLRAGMDPSAHFPDRPRKTRRGFAAGAQPMAAVLRLGGKSQWPKSTDQRGPVAGDPTIGVSASVRDGRNHPPVSMIRNSLAGHARPNSWLVTQSAADCTRASCSPALPLPSPLH